nr:hypothetical protein [Glycine max]
MLNPCRLNRSRMCLLLQETLDSQREGSHPFSPFLNESSSQLRAGGGYPNINIKLSILIFLNISRFFPSFLFSYLTGNAFTLNTNPISMKKPTPDPDVNRSFLGESFFSFFVDFT